MQFGPKMWFPKETKRREGAEKFFNPGEQPLVNGRLSVSILGHLQPVHEIRGDA
jgi:hypothetical protein